MNDVCVIRVIRVRGRSKFCLAVLFLYEHSDSAGHQQQPDDVERAGVGGCAGHDDARGDGGDDRGLSALHEPDRADGGEAHGEAAEEHDCPLSGRGHHERRGGEEDGQQHGAEEDELVRDRVRVRGLEPRELGVDESEEDAGHELEQLGGGVVVLEQHRARDHAQEEELVAAEAAAPERLPAHCEEDAARPVPAHEDAEHHRRVEHGADGLEAAVVGSAGQVGHELVVAHDRQVVDQEGDQEGEVNVLQRGDSEERRRPQLQHHQRRHKGDQRQRRQRHLRLAAHLLVLEVVPLDPRHDRSHTTHLGRQSRQLVIANQSLSKFLAPHFDPLFDECIPVHSFLEVQIEQAYPVLLNMSTRSGLHILLGICPQLLKISSDLLQFALVLGVHDHHKQTVFPQFYAADELAIMDFQPARSDFQVVVHEVHVALGVYRKDLGFGDVSGEDVLP